MAAGQTNLVQLLSKTEEEFCPIFFYPLTTTGYLISDFENNKRGKIFILGKKIIPDKYFFTYPPA